MTQAVHFGIGVGQTGGQAGKALDVPSTGRQDGGVATDCILTERGEIEIGVTLHPMTRYLLHCSYPLLCVEGRPSADVSCCSRRLFNFLSNDDGLLVMSAMVPVTMSARPSLRPYVELRQWPRCWCPPSGQPNRRSRSLTPA